jgi:hypothetical protein
MEQYPKGFITTESPHNIGEFHISREVEYLVFRDLHYVE